MDMKALTDAFIGWLRKRSLKLLMAGAFKTLGGWKLYLAEKVFNLLFDKIVVPGVKYLVRKGRATYRKGVVSIVVDAREGAKSEADFDSAVDDLFK